MLIQVAKNKLKRMFLHDLMNVGAVNELKAWERSGKPVPPPHLFKQKIIIEYAKKYSIHVLIETGTYLGEMVDATKNTFDRIISIELDRVLYENAKKKFSGLNSISIIQGDSGEMLPAILSELNEPTLFWLDGHYSGGVTARSELETPIVRELELLLNHHIAEHVVLIDDARLFIGQDDYPTIEELRNLVLSKRPGSVFEVENDIIRVHENHLR